jgi:Icc protein
MTDIHVQPELRAAEGMAAALHDAQSLEDPVELIVTGGDLIMDCFDATEARSQEQWTLFGRVLKENCRVPVQHCLGNHDFWGGNAQRSRTRGDEPRWGKAWAREVLGLPADHHSFERGGWKFLVLDSVRRLENGYTGLIDPAQFEWLRSELAATPKSTPIVVVSHIPLLTVTIIANDPKRAKDLSITLPGDLMHSDSAKLCGLFAQHPNVKLCLSGHIHQLDRIEWRGVTFICDGAVSGAWWKGPNGPTPEGYGVVDLYDDGSFDWAYRTYGWEAKAK